MTKRDRYQNDVRARARLALTALLFPALLVLLPQESLAQRKTYENGRVTSALCPYSCRTKGIPKKHCKDWKEAGRCFVEDLTRPPAKISSVTHIGSSSGQDAMRFSTEPAVKSKALQGEQVVPKGCKGKAPYELSEPLIDIVRARRSGKPQSTNYRLEGNLEGVCLIEAGYFEKGRLIKRIPLQTVNVFSRFPFSFQINSERQPEIRVYNTAGERASIPVEVNSYLGAPLKKKNETLKLP